MHRWISARAVSDLGSESTQEALDVATKFQAENSNRLDPTVGASRLAIGIKTSSSRDWICSSDGRQDCKTQQHRAADPLVLNGSIAP